MKIELPLLLARRGPRLWEVWLLATPFIARGSSLAALRDDAALAVMERFERADVSELGAFQRAPHQRLVHVEVDTVARDQRRGIKRPLEGRVAVLLEKWPGDDFWIATPTRIPGATFVVERPDDVPAALDRSLVAFSLERDLESLAPYVASDHEQLEILEVDVYPPSPLPRAPKRADRPAGRRPDETGVEREERRRRRRLSAKTLREVGRNLSHAADDDALERAFAREGLAESLADELTVREGTALVLVGPSGVGKTAVVHEVCRRLARRVRAGGRRRDVWRVDGGRFIAGCKYVGEWEARARVLCEELVETGDVLYADDLASLVWAGRAGNSDNNLARFLEPYLGRGEITVVAESTAERLESVREETPGFASLFRVVVVPPLGERESLAVLLGVLRELEAEEGTGPAPRLSPAALEALVAGVCRFSPTSPLPGPAVRLLRRVLAGPGKVVGDERRFETADVLEALRGETGLPPFVVGTAPPRTRAEVEADLGAMVAGQPEAIEAVTDVVMTLQAGVGDPDKPLATLLFVGPTGVGKTETAKALARYLFGGDERLVRFDMSELASPDSVSRLVGQAGGQDGELAVALRSQPFRVILFDEVEKAHPRVFDALLQLLDEGRLTDASGRLADARQAVIVMTSNLGVREAASRAGFVNQTEDSRHHFIAAVQAFFRPELFNRIDRIVPFRALDAAALRVVVEQALGELLSRRGIQQGNVIVEVEPSLLDLLVEQAHDPRYGARPLRRALERELTVPLALHLATRHGGELALVELYGQGDTLGLSVRVLADAAASEGPADPAWTLERIRAEVVRMREALRALGSPPDWTIDVVAALHDDLHALDEEQLAETTYVEDPEEPVDGRYWRRPPYEIPVTARRRALERGSLPRVLALRDRLTLLEHQLAAREAPCTLLLECVGLFDAGALEAAASAALVELLRPRRLEEREGVWASPVSDSRPIRRLAFSYDRPGAREILEGLEGWALVRIPAGAREVTVPVRLELLDGVGPEVITRRDRAVVAERARPGAAPGVVTLRGQGGAVVAVATGTPTRPEPAFAAALLRIPR